MTAHRVTDHQAWISVRQLHDTLLVDLHKDLKQKYMRTF